MMRASYTPLVYLPTGIENLDLLTGGGSVYLTGPVGAGKTALAVKTADTFLQRGICVGVLAVDDEPSDIATRLLQRRGLTRAQCEERSAETLAKTHELLDGLPLLLFDWETSIEQAAAELHRFAAGRPAVLVVDSLQAASCENEAADRSIDEAVVRRVVAIQAAASRYRMLLIVTSDDPLTFRFSSKVSAAIRSSANVLLAMRELAPSRAHPGLAQQPRPRGQKHDR